MAQNPPFSPQPQSSEPQPGLEYPPIPPHQSGNLAPPRPQPSQPLQEAPERAYQAQWPPASQPLSAQPQQFAPPQQGGQRVQQPPEGTFQPQWGQPSQPLPPQQQQLAGQPGFPQQMMPQQMMPPQQQYGYPQIQQQVFVMPQAAPVVNVNINQSGPGFFVRALYFIFIGWWVGFWWLNISYFFILTIIGLPLGLVMLNRLPQVMTLKPASQSVKVSVSGGVTNINIGGAQQHPFWLRAIYFIFVGSWAGYIWASIAYAMFLFIFTIPVGVIMFNMLPMVTTLRKN